MKRNSIFIILLGLIPMFSCQREEPEGVASAREVSIIASVADTKTALQGSAVMWEDGDAIDVVFSGPSSFSVTEFTTAIEEGAAASARFTGFLAPEVSLEGGFAERGFAVYPKGAVGSDGAVRFELPAEQTTREDGTFLSGVNLSSASLSLSELDSGEPAKAAFKNAFSVLRFKLSSDVTKLTLTGTSPLAGAAPLKFCVSDDSDNGRLVIDEQVQWDESDKSMSVSILPPGSDGCFTEGTVYNLLVLPGTHTSLTLDVTFASETLGEYTKSVNNTFVFKPAKFYTLNFKSDADELVTELSGKVGALEDALPGVGDNLDDLEDQVEQLQKLLSQIQSVALMTEYTNNAVYAPYARLNYSLLKKDITLDYIVRPAEVLESILEVCGDDVSKVFSAVLDTRSGVLAEVNVSSAGLDGDVLSVTLDAAAVPNSFYDGGSTAAVALEISDGNTEILSDFANLVARESIGLSISKTDDVPALKGARLSLPFSYAAPGAGECEVIFSDVRGFGSAPTVTLSGGSGYIYADFDATSDPSQMGFTVTLKCSDESDSQNVTFVDGGAFDIVTSGEVDYIGGEISIDVTANSFGSYTSELQGGGSWIYQTNLGSNSLLTVEKNTSSRRTAKMVFTIKNAQLSYVKSIELAQKAYGSAIDESRYHQHKSSLQLNAATAGYTPLNVVIVGDGYQKRDLQKGGKFERSARSACEAFFGVEPYKSFRDRFNVMMLACESVDEGISLEGGVQKDTYFKSYYKGSGNTYVNLPGGDYSSVINVIRNDLGLSSDASYYRTIVLMLINTSEGVGSNAAVYRAAYGNTSLLGEPYASFALAMVAANTSETSNLVRHEAGGHAFGRLGDEYQGKTYGSDLDDLHGIGWYRNVTTDQSKWNWNEFSGLAGYGDVTYYMPSGANFWCPTPHTTNSIMYNNLNKFNAPSRRIIFERIIRQTEGASAYSWGRFLEYDKRNL